MQEQMDRSHWQVRWHERRSGLVHLKWFENLCDLHELTLAWISDLKIDRADTALSRGLGKEALENVWMLESIRDTQLDDFLDDTSAEDLLARLDHTIWAVQAATLEQIQSQDPSALRAILEQTAFRFGRNLAESRWRAWSELGQSRADLALAALHDSPFAGHGFHPSFLVRRKLAHEFQFLWRSCPHSRHYPEIGRSQTLLCDLHYQALRGYIYALNPRLELTLRRLTSTEPGECLIQCQRSEKHPTL